MSDWREEAVSIAEIGDMSWRKIAEKLGKPKSTVSDMLRKHFHSYNLTNEITEPAQDFWDRVESERDKQLKNKYTPDDSKYQCTDEKWAEFSENMGETTAHKEEDILSSMSDAELIDALNRIRDSDSKSISINNVRNKPRKNRHFIIGDTQAKPDVCLKYHTSIGQYIADKQPEVIVHIGDFADLPSLSSYDKGKRSFEGRRLIKDLDACKEALRLLMQPIYDLQEQQRSDGVKVYSPRIVITLGNHEFRLFRMMDDQPEFEGLLGDDPFGYKAHGWEVYDFLTPVYIDGISYIHYMPNPMTGKPYGGSALNILKNVGHSFVVGHKQCLDIAIRPIVGGKMQIGIVNGACYPHEEAYKGVLWNLHFRGATMLSEVEDGYGDPMFISLSHMMERFNT